MLVDPITKALISKFGGLIFSGYFEIANRLVMQLKGVLVSSTQSLMPIMVKMTVSGKDIDSKNSFYKKILIGVASISFFLFVALALSSKLISLIWIGHIEDIFVNCIYLCSIFTYINLLCVPAYFIYMSSGSLGILIKCHILIGAVNALLGYFLGFFAGGYGVLMAAAFATILGSLYIIMNYHIKNKINLMDIKKEDFFYFFMYFSKKV
jgi:O-antigen/teichoic acid export membrane protein